MDFIDLKAQQKRIRDRIDRHIADVLSHGRYIMGPEVTALESRLAEFAGTRHALGAASGTDALLMALMAHDVGPGDAVITTPFTFIATAEVICLLGAVPVFVDIDPDTFNIDPGQIEAAVRAFESRDSSVYPLPEAHLQAGGNLKLKGIIPVDLFGLPCDYDRIRRIAVENDLFVIEDAAQSFGAEYHGKRAGGLAEVACTSFFPAKPLGCYGDGGMCFTDDDALAERMASIRIHGKGRHKYDNVRIGINGRLDTMQAAILLAKFDLFPEEIQLRQAAADRYGALLGDLQNIRTPGIPEGMKSVWAQYSILAQDAAHRSVLLESLRKNGVPTAIYYPLPLHMQEAFAFLGYSSGAFPVSEDFATRIFSIPMHPYLEETQQRRIAAAIRDA